MSHRCAIMQAARYGALILLLAFTARAQNIPCSESGILPIDVLHLQTRIGGASSGTILSTENEGYILWEVIVGRVVGGNIRGYIDPAGISCAGGNHQLSSMSTTAIFDLIARATINSVVAGGLQPCPSSCQSPIYVTISTASCVQRVGLETGPYFSGCSAGCCARTYSVCCPEGSTAPLILFRYAQDSGCTGVGCESTCP